MNKKVYKWCAVPLCKNTSITTPQKLFVHVPIKKKIRIKWLKLAWRNPEEISMRSPLYFCEDHFDLPNDMENYMQYHVMGSVSQIRMKIGCMPKKFICQPDRTILTSDILKEYQFDKKSMKTFLECEKHFEEKSILTEQSSAEEIASGSSVQHDVEEVPQLTPRVLDTAIQVNMFKAFQSKANETQLPNDMDNYMQYHIVGTVAQVRMIPGCTPTKFECQPDRKKRTCGKERPYILKKKRMKVVEECLNKSEIKTTSCTSLQDTSNINCHTVEEHAEEILCKQEETSVQIMTLINDIKEDFENKSQDDILNLHTTIDIKQDIEDIDSSVQNLSSASSSRTNSACGSPTRESHIETITKYEPQTTIDVTIMKEEPGSPLSDVSIHRPRDILTEIAADVDQQHTQEQSQQNIRLKQIRHANCERQRKYREKQKAAKIKACTISSKIQQQTNDVEIIKRRQIANERLRKHRRLKREKQQQQMEDNVNTVLSNKNVDPEHAPNSQKHLNKLQQSKLRARQRLKSPSTSLQQQELVTQKNVDHNSHQDASEDLHSSDPSHSTDSCSQTITTLQKEINKDLDLHESPEDDILDLHVEIRQEDLEDIEASIPIPTYLILKKKDQHKSVANPSSASCSQTNSPCGSPTRESHIETFIEYEPLTTIDDTAMMEEPGPLSDVSIHSDAASPEEQAIEIKLRKKMEMLSHNEEIIKCRREEISILEKNNEQLLADIKYLQNVAKKKC